MLNPIATAIKGKGVLDFLQRGTNLARRYGITPGRMEKRVKEFAAILTEFGCGATFPITAVALHRNPEIIKKLTVQDIEFAIHGYRHIDHSNLSADQQSVELESAKQVFAEAGIQARGFRSPYLRWNSGTLIALQRKDIAYDASSALTWDVLDSDTPVAYRHVMDFYGARPAAMYPSLPSLQEKILRIPYALPDDEALVERLALRTPAQMSAIWSRILRRTYELGELFVLGLHPERLPLCREPLRQVLAEARRLTPAVWIARLDEIDAWWRARTATVVTIVDETDNRIRIIVHKPGRAIVLARAVNVDVATTPWADNYVLVQAREFSVPASPRPFIGLAPATPPRLTQFLQQQGYIVETSTQSSAYSCYFEQHELTGEQERLVLSAIENTNRPLVRLGRWPNGARSALAITGDIDALTIWDYGFRILGK